MILQDECKVIERENQRVCALCNKEFDVKTDAYFSRIIGHDENYEPIEPYRIYTCSDCMISSDGDFA